MIIAAPDGKLYSQFWGEEDGFSRTHYQEITGRYAAYLCKASSDFVVFRDLGLLERFQIIWKPPIDVTWE